MRLTLAGLILLCISTAALAQAEGEVESIGFEGWYRPNCWTPVKLKLRPKTGASQDYKLQIIQEDMDRDRAAYTRPFTLSGNPEGRVIEERVWVYFLPQPRELKPSMSAPEMTSVVKVFLCDTSGRQLVQIPFPPSTTSLRSLDETSLKLNNRGTRLVLLVAASGSQPQVDVYRSDSRGIVRGVNEEITFVRISPSELPGNVLGFDAVDQIIWLNADPADLNSDSMAALQDYVRDGGRLLVCQNRDVQRIKQSELAEMLPVTITDVAEEKGLASLRKLIGTDNGSGPVSLRPIPTALGQNIDPWGELKGKPFSIARAVPKLGAMVNLWSAGEPQSPYLARWMYGLGTVAWVAQDFGDPTMHTRAPDGWIGWARAWDRICDWPNDTFVWRKDLAETENTALRQEYDRGYRNYDGERTASADLSTAMLKGMEHGGTGAALVALAMLFFVAYWVLAGPGSYFFLLARKRAHYSWVAFAICALIATGITALVVRLVLRGPPEVKHITFVRMARDQDALVQSNLGIYIKRDGAQRIELKETAPKRISYITPYPVHPHPAHFRDSGEYPAPLEYEVPIQDRNSTELPAISVPYRSTSKKFQVKWVGRLKGGIEGILRLNGRGLQGRLVNSTGHDLQAVHMIYRPGSTFGLIYPDDWMIQFSNAKEVSLWPKDQALDLGELWDKADIAGIERKVRTQGSLGVRGGLNLGWNTTWASDFLPNVDAAYQDMDRAALLMSVFDRLAPVKAESAIGSSWFTRYELLRRAGRHLDASNAVSCGHVLVFAKADGPLPYPLEIEGRSIQGEGTTYYQFIVPVDRGGATTAPAPEDEDVKLERAATSEPSLR